MSGAVIEAVELTKRFRGVTALDKVSLSIDGGGPIGLVGKNGAGKTTLLSIVSGIMRPSSGSVRVLGRSPGEAATRGELGVLMQDAAFRRAIPGMQQLVHLARLQGIPAARARAQIQALLEELGGGDFASRGPETLSYGQRKRLGIAQALVGNPRLVLLDEPTAGLDPVAAGAVRALVRRQAAERLLIISSHNLYEIEDVCRRIVIIDRGKLVADEDIARLTAGSNTIMVTLDREPPAAVRTALLQLPEITELGALPGGRTGLCVHFACPDADRLQLAILAVLTEHGCSVLGLTRERTLADGVLPRLSGEDA